MGRAFVSALGFAAVVAAACSSFDATEDDAPLPERDAGTDPDADSDAGGELPVDESPDMPDASVVDATTVTAPHCNGSLITDDFQRDQPLDKLKWTGSLVAANSGLATVDDADFSSRVLRAVTPKGYYAFLWRDLYGVKSPWDLCVDFSIKILPNYNGSVYALRLLSAATKSAFSLASSQIVALSVGTDQTLTLVQDAHDGSACPAPKTCTTTKTAMGSLADRRRHHVVVSIHATNADDGTIDFAFDEVGARVPLSVALAEQAARELRFGLQASSTGMAVSYDDAKIDSP